MLFDFTYNEIEYDSKSFFSEKSSRFISYAYKVNNVSDVKSRLQNIKKVEKSANHYCYAYVLKHDQSDFRMNDDGEPSSTAGKQIYNVIKKFNLTNIIVIVVRYFGGTKLGISGLIRCYRSCATLAINNSKIINKKIIDLIEINFKIEHINSVMKIIKNENLKIKEQKISTTSKIILETPRKKVDEILKKLNSDHKLEANIL
tara:strand:+ start:331 stop:936 length:606 start_codon:yes stop_codon:yes gene_type:complete